MLGLWAAVVWQMMGAPDPVILAEAGPGRGTLMADALRAIGRAAPAFRAALRLHLVETSPRLRALQAGRLPGAAWHDRIADLPAGPLLLLANEFLDALPIRQFVRRGAGWTERYVAEGRFVELPAAAPGLATRPRARWWRSARRRGRWRPRSARRLAAHRRGGAVHRLRPGAAGAGRQPAGAARPGAGRSAGRPGRGRPDRACRFRRRRRGGAGGRRGGAGAGAAGMFLARLGLPQRTDALARGQPPARAAALMEAARRLTEPHAMGRLFKALALCHPGLPELPGFAP